MNATYLQHFLSINLPHIPFNILILYVKKIEEFFYFIYSRIHTYLFEIARFESLPYEAMNLYSPDNNFAGYQANSENLIRVPNL